MKPSALRISQNYCACGDNSDCANRRRDRADGWPFAYSIESRQHREGTGRDTEHDDDDPNGSHV